MRHGVGIVLVAVYGVAGACDVAPVPGAYGPLAVTDTDVQSVSAARGGEGTLTIDESCVTLAVDEARRITLVFRRDQVQWNAATGEVLFKDPLLGPLVLTNGDSVEVGGEGLGSWIGGEPPTARRWVSPPNRVCPADLFEVHVVNPT